MASVRDYWIARLLLWCLTSGRRWDHADVHYRLTRAPSGDVRLVLAYTDQNGARIFLKRTDCAPTIVATILNVGESLADPKRR